MAVPNSEQVARIFKRYKVTNEKALIRAVRDEMNEEMWQPGDGPKFTLFDASLQLDSMYEAEYQRINSGWYERES